MEKLENELKQIKGVISLYRLNDLNKSIRVTLSNGLCEEGDISKVHSLLERQTYFEYSIEIVD